MPALSYIPRRLLGMIPTLAIISVIVFAIIQLPPGDIVTSTLDQMQASGLDMSDERVLQQLAEKHPTRQEQLPGGLADFAPFRRVHVDLTEVLRQLDPRAGVGPSGFRNTYLRALTEQFEDAKARSALDLLNEFADKYVNAEFPAWFYAVFTAVKLVAPVKTPP